MALWVSKQTRHVSTRHFRIQLEDEQNMISHSQPESPLGPYWGQFRLRFWGLPGGPGGGPGGSREASGGIPGGPGGVPGHVGTSAGELTVPEPISGSTWGPFGVLLTPISASLRGPIFEAVLGTLLEPLPQSMQPAPKPNGGPKTAREGLGRRSKTKTSKS